MISNIDKYVDFLCKHRLSESQFLLLWLIHTKDEKNIAKYEEVKHKFSNIEIQYLIDIGFLEDNLEDRAIDQIVTEKFTKIVVIDEDDAYEQLCEVYPKWMTVKGVKWPMHKGDPSKHAQLYYKAIKGNRLEHDRIVNITRKYHENHAAMSNIEDYILNKRWNLLEEEVSSSQQVFKSL